jgi:enoyl-CoA hydratase/carnithine racemase
MTAARPVTVEGHDRTRLIILDRPSALNAFNGALFDAVREALDGAAADPEVACVAITGRGRAFSAGMDLAPGDDPPSPEEPGGYDAFIEVLEGFPKPLVAAVNGLAVGIGATLLGHADLVLAAESARFRFPFAALGLCPEAGSTDRLPRLIGDRAAAHALFTAGWISARAAHEAGLVWRLVPDEELLAETLAVCAEIQAMPVESLETTKRLLLAARVPAARAAREREEGEFRRLAAGPAHQEALAAFREKRAPDFRAAGRRSPGAVASGA